MRSIKSSIFLPLMLVATQAAAFDLFDEYYCAPPDIQGGGCKKGDLMFVLSARAALRFCDFDKEVIPYSAGDKFVCHYSGDERKRRVGAVNASGHDSPATPTEPNPATEEVLVNAKYPDWKKTVNTADFKKWLGVQSEWVLALADSDKADDAILLLDLYQRKIKLTPVDGNPFDKFDGQPKRLLTDEEVMRPAWADDPVVGQE